MCMHESVRPGPDSAVEQGIGEHQWFFRAMVQATPADKNTGWDLNDNKPVDLPDQVPAGQPQGQAPR